MTLCISCSSFCMPSRKEWKLLDKYEKISFLDYANFMESFETKFDKWLAIANDPPKYFSFPNFLNVKTDSFPDFPKASQKKY